MYVCVSEFAGIGPVRYPLSIRWAIVFFNVCLFLYVS